MKVAFWAPPFSIRQFLWEPCFGFGNSLTVVIIHLNIQMKGNKQLACRAKAPAEGHRFAEPYLQSVHEDLGRPESESFLW